MSWAVDARIPVSLVTEADLPADLARGGTVAVLMEAPPPSALPAGAAVLASFEAGGPTHPVACACCTGRPPVAAALDRLFQARVRGQCAWFERVVAAVDGTARQAVAAALEGDALTRARYRLG